ncbi:biliverdin-producing heme oxygenase [Pseudohoeflea coraliihabitans]|uniref:Biliverdin-producing heme oxygenase n=1 Tax=Pseudohoeflea coraliihabitans TaxID=2860393 RepID=A0ABS6WKD0_9HYPH|nr:biliverdin-producing heme oxygenase [Pseudohoeflea sp. DP4N28-3]MBW3096403.1 biliverdin-producing heme oxygenase [Pseudohoeflea sp. DP4N28-3]
MFQILSGADTQCIRNHLRQETRAAHAAVDRIFPRQQIVTPVGYLHFLNVHASIVPAAEAHICASGHADDLPDLKNRLRTDALLHDRRAMAGDEIIAAEVSFLHSRSAVAGLLYVLEGSRLGSKIIASWLFRHEPKCDFPTAFLAHGDRQNYWSSYLAWLEAQEWSATDRAEMADAALAVFSAYLTAHERQLAHGW